MKRALDVAVAAAVLAATWPLLVLIALAVRLTSGSPVLFRQLRPGLYGRLFTMYKFRTMRSGSGSDQDRLTRFGRWLRSTSLDELPELWNVLRGDMSLVGPRPLLAEYLDLYGPTELRRHAVRPGITGLAQVNGRNELDWQERFALDLRYVEEQSLALDLRILARTVRNVATRHGINAPGAATMPVYTGATPSA